MLISVYRVGTLNIWNIDRNWCTSSMVHWYTYDLYGISKTVGRLLRLYLNLSEKHVKGWSKETNSTKITLRAGISQRLVNHYNSKHESTIFPPVKSPNSISCDRRATMELDALAKAEADLRVEERQLGGGTNVSGWSYDSCGIFMTPWKIAGYNRVISSLTLITGTPDTSTYSRFQMGETHEMLRCMGLMVVVVGWTCVQKLWPPGVTHNVGKMSPSIGCENVTSKGSRTNHGQPMEKGVSISTWD